MSSKAMLTTQSTGNEQRLAPTKMVMNGGLLIIIIIIIINIIISVIVITITIIVFTFHHIDGLFLGFDVKKTPKYTMMNPLRAGKRENIS